MSGCVVPNRCVPVSSGSSGRRSRCDLCPRGGSGHPGVVELADFDAGRDRSHAGRCVGRRRHGDDRAGIFGDILCERMKVRGVAALVTDGVVRDAIGVIRTGLPAWCAGVAAPPSVAGLTFVNWQQPIGCGGVAVFPDDVIVADEDGAVVIPNALVDEVADTAAEQEMLEEWIVREVQGGASLPGLYPPNAENKARYRSLPF